MRMGMRPFTRLTNGFSKKLQNHGHPVALHFLHSYTQFLLDSQEVEGHSSKWSAGIATYVWSAAELLELLGAGQSAT